MMKAHRWILIAVITAILALYAILWTNLWPARLGPQSWALVSFVISLVGACAATRVAQQRGYRFAATSGIFIAGLMPIVNLAVFAYTLRMTRPHPHDPVQ
jgi:hypothetical protein